MSLWGMLAEFESPQALAQAAERVREAGYTRWDCYSPFPVHGLERAMGLKDTRLPWIVLGGGVVGAVGALLLQWWTNGVDYPFVIGGKPYFGVPAAIPITFELTILVSAITAFLCMFAFNRLPQLYHPTFRSERFRRATNDRFFLAIEAADPRFELERTEALLRGAGSTHLERLED
jgi:ActD protein